MTITTRFKAGDIAVAKNTGLVLRVTEVLPNRYGKTRVAAQDVTGGIYRMNDYNLQTLREIVQQAKELKAKYSK